MIRKGSELLIATTNAGKAKEISKALSDLALTIRTLNDFKLVQLVEESGETYEENAKAKAIGYAAQTGLYALADDSGLEVDYLGGRPGIHSARFGGCELSDLERNQHLLKSMSNTSFRGARFISVVALAGPSPDKMREARILSVTQGICEGTITFASRGENGFGYDSLFLPKDYEKTFGELADSVKNQISHRAIAIARMHDFLQSMTLLDHT